MVHDAGQISVGKCNAPERRRSQNFAGRRFSISAEEKAGLRIEIGVPPAVQNDALRCLAARQNRSAQTYSVNCSRICRSYSLKEVASISPRPRCP